MTLIKYYKTNTCYDGQKEFIKSNNNSLRHYPDEYLIAHILEKYRQKRFPDSQNIIVLTEPWVDSMNQPIREGKKNTRKINELIIHKIETAKKTENTLILVPFLYGYHHPGITIDVRNKTAIYLDPYGVEAHYDEAKDLQELLKEKRFSLLTVTTRQQTDSVSCGPILTASMIKFMEEFIATGNISVNNFKAPRPYLATERLFQMYVNNTGIEKVENLVDEVMLADEELWGKVFHEQKLPTEIGQKILDSVKKQKKFVESLPKNWEENSSQKLTVEFIKNFQSQITEYLFLKDIEIDSLVTTSNQLFEQKDPAFDDSRSTELFKKQNLLNKDQIARTHKMIGLMDYSKKSVKQIEGNILNFEEDKNDIQEQFKTSLQTLKDNLGSLSKDEGMLKEAGQILFDTLSKKQEEFFQELQATSTEEELTTKIINFRKICAENIKIADKIMGHGWLYRTVEVLIKAVVGLFAGIGMILGSVFGQGLVKLEHREKFAKTFFTLNQNEQSQALTTFKQEILGEGEENQGLLSTHNLKSMIQFPSDLCAFKHK